LFAIHSCSLPDGAFLASYTRAGAYTDCYVTESARSVSQAEYVAAFYTTPVFKLERVILKWAVSRPSTDAEAKQLASGVIDKFAAWHVEKRSADQLLLSDLRGATRSWLMVAPLETPNGSGTRLYFGSAVVPVRDSRTGKATMGPGFRALLGFHKIYSEVLLYSARSRLRSAAR
jgi:hypothetical protein